MTDIEQKALALVNEVLAERRLPLYDEEDIAANTYVAAAICRAIEQHEAFRQEVSDAVVAAKAYYEVPMYDLSAFIIAKPDPLVEAFSDIGTIDPNGAAKDFRAALAARGLEIVKKEPSP